MRGCGQQQCAAHGAPACSCRRPVMAGAQPPTRLAGGGATPAHHTTWLQPGATSRMRWVSTLRAHEEGASRLPAATLLPCWSQMGAQLPDARVAGRPCGAAECPFGPPGTQCGNQSSPAVESSQQAVTRLGTAEHGMPAALTARRPVLASPPSRAHRKKCSRLGMWPGCTSFSMLTSHPSKP